MSFLFVSPLTVLPSWAMVLVAVSLELVVYWLPLVSPLLSVLLPVLVLILVLPYQSLLRLPLSYIDIIDNFYTFKILCLKYGFFQTLQFEDSVSDIVIFYLDYFAGLIAPFWVILLPLPVVVLFLLKDLDHIIHFHLRVFASILFPPCQINPDIKNGSCRRGRPCPFIFVDEWTVSLYWSNALDNIAV